jgi:hypothetical protein
MTADLLTKVNGARIVPPSHGRRQLSSSMLSARTPFGGFGMAPGSKVSSKYFFLIVPPIVLFIAMDAAVVLFADLEINDLSLLLPVRPSATLEAASRFQFLGANILFLAVVVGLAIKAVQDLIPINTPKLDWRFVLAGLVGIAVTLSQFAIAPPTDLQGRYTASMGLQIFVEALNSATVIESGGWWDQWVFASICSIYTTAVGVVGTLVGLVLISCLAEPQGKLEGEALERHWSEQRDRLGIIVYLGTSTLALGVIVLRAELSYPMFAIAPDQLRNYVALLNARCAYAGIEYSLMLSSIILPIIAIVASKSAGAAKQVKPAAVAARPPAKAKQNATSHGPGDGAESTSSVMGVVRLILALLLPLLTGALSGLGSAPA